MDLKTKKSEFLNEALGLSEERHEEIGDFMEEVINTETEKISDHLKALVAGADNLEEAVFMVYHFARFVESRDAKINALARFMDLGGIAKN